MTDTKQPEALRLADELESEGDSWFRERDAEAAAELRRLHAIEAEHIKLCRDYQDTWDSRDRLHAENQQLRADLEAIGAGGVGPLMPATVQHQHKSNIDNDLQRENGHLITSSSIVPAGWKLVPVTPTPEMIRVMCAYDGTQYSNTFDSDDFKEDYRNMLAAAPQPQANQPAMTPIAQRKLEDLVASGYTISGYSVYHERKHQHGFVTGAGLVGWWKPDGVEYPQPQGEQEPMAWQSIEAMAVQRYKVVPAHDSMFYRHAVVAGDGTQQLYIGRETECENIARRFAGAFLDGAYEASLYTQPQNLSCKSNQTRLATLWGYVKEQPPRQPLTDEQWLKLWTGRTGQRLKPGPDRDRLLRRFRFAERAHGIGGAA